jgi:rRNA maturation RNase YbeY
MKFILLNRQRIRSIRRTPLIALAHFLADCAFAPGTLRPIEITLTLVDHEHIRPLKQRYWKQDVTTDVIAFTYEAPPPALAGAAIGDLIVNVQQAIDVGPRLGGETHELALYLAHGLDHLTGADDNTPARRRAMRQRELGWLRRARAAGLLKPQIFRSVK